MAAQAPRAMAMQAEAIQPGWSAEMRFPKAIRLPVVIANIVLRPGEREIVIKNHDQTLPGLVVQWMQSDPRYRRLFGSEDAKPTVPVEEPEVEPRPEGTPVEVETPEPVEEDDKPKRSRRKKAADDGEEHA